MGYQRHLQPEKKGFNYWLILPIIGGLGMIGLLLCAGVFAVYAIFFYNPSAPASRPTATPTLEIVRFSADDDAAAGAAATPAAPTESAETDSPPPADQPQQPPAAGSDPAAPAGDQPAAQPPAVSSVTPIINTEPVKMTSPDYGMQAFLFWQEEIADRDLKLIEDAGFRWVKQEFAWREIEPVNKGEFDWSRTDRIMDQVDAHNLKIIVRLGVQPEWAGGGFPEIGPPNNMQDFADFARAVAERYKGRIDAYQIWNEPNLAREWGNRPPNAAEYTQMLKATSEAIKSVDPFPLIISAGLAPTTRNDDVARPDTYYIQEMYDAGAAPYFDALGAHGPGYASPPEMDPA